MNRDNMMHIDDPDHPLTKKLEEHFDERRLPDADRGRKVIGDAVRERKPFTMPSATISNEEIMRVGIKDKHKVRSDQIANVVEETGQVMSVGVDMGGRDEVVELTLAELNDGRFVVMDDRRVTAEELKAESAKLEARARRGGLAADFSGIDHEALARETNNRDRDVIGWEPPQPPPSWTELERDVRGGKYANYARRLTVIVSCSIENDGRAWLHLSVSHKARIPTWGEVTLVKEAFLGNREAYQVLPPKERYVNIHPYVLNLFALLDGEALPDFTRGTGGI